MQIPSSPYLHRGFYRGFYLAILLVMPFWLGVVSMVAWTGHPTQTRVAAGTAGRNG